MRRDGMRTRKRWWTSSFRELQDANKIQRASLVRDPVTVAEREIRLLTFCADYHHPLSRRGSRG